MPTLPADLPTLLAASALLLLTGVALCVLGARTPRASHLAYFGALCVGWALLDSRRWLPPLPLPLALAPTAGALAAGLLLGLMAWAAVQCLLRTAGLRYRAVDRGLPLQWVLMAVTLVLAGPQRLPTVASVWTALLACETVSAAVWALRHGPAAAPTTPARPAASARRLTLGGLGVALLVAAIVAQGPGALPLPVASAAPWLSVLAAAGLLMLGLQLVLQHGRALQHAEQDARDDGARLALRVAEATVEIERDFRQMAELRVEQVTERERKRIAADLHDDLGAKLLTIVHTSESERISTLAREALEEMRLSVRGLSGRPVRLADALGDWRAEVVSRLGQAGIEGQWDAPEDLPQTLSARAYVQTTRILREATSNIIKHSGATHCTVQAGLNDDDFQLVVQDNGGGIGSEIDGRLDRGHGLASMKNRARQLRGQCLVESTLGLGTVIRLTVPLDRATESS